MKGALRLADYLVPMQQAAAQAMAYVEGMDKAGFLNDKRTQQAAILNLVILGEAAANVITTAPDFAQQHPEVPWRAVRATRNRLAHGYFDLNLDVVWDTVQTGLPQLLAPLPGVLDAARRDDSAAPPTTPNS